MFNQRSMWLGLFFIFFCQTASAKVFYKNKQIQDVHLSGIKGFLYESIMSAPPDVKDKLIIKFARACTWLNEVHNNQKTFKLEEIGTEDSQLIIQTIEYIVKILLNQDLIYKPHDLTRWSGLGYYIDADYKETITYNEKTDEYTLRMGWKLEITKPQFPPEVNTLKNQF